MTEEEKIFVGQLFCPGDPALKAIKLRAHKLSQRYSQLAEDQAADRTEILSQLVGKMGKGCFFQGPIFFHYGTHTSIGDALFCNYNFTVQDDAKVTIGNHCDFGPNVSIVTPVHPMLPDERYLMLNEKGEEKHMCYARPVAIGSHCWFGANVVVCPGVTIGDNCVIGAGSVVTKDIPANSFAAGCPCGVIREITEADSMNCKPEILAGNRTIPRDRFPMEGSV